MVSFQKNAIRFIYLLGITSLFADITYEGARSITGPFLSVLGASAAVVGLVAGLGEFIGYGLRLLSGYLSDRLGKHWLFTFIGYAAILSVPALALTNHWQLACLLIILERSGKAIRTPARDAMLSHATREIGRGKGFGLHEALDQIGAVAGPLLIAAILYLKKGYAFSFAVLLIPAILALLSLLIARIKFPEPMLLEKSFLDTYQDNNRKRFSSTFWIYTIFIIFSVAGFAHFQLISYHFKSQSVVSDAQIPILFALAMGVDGLVALIIGRIYDRVGLAALSSVPIFTIPIPLLLFSNYYFLVILGVILWGIVMGIQETIMRAAIADITPIETRGMAYGIFNTAYGLAWFLGTSLMGLLYSISIRYIFIFVVMMEIISFLFLFLAKRKKEILEG